MENAEYAIQDKEISSSLIAPCGMNCALCLAYQREDNHCEGCRNKAKRGVKNCVIKNCRNISSIKSSFCFECEKYPCSRLRQLDKRYKDKYNMSMIENLENINNFGLKEFLNKQTIRWSCPKCHELLCVHRDYCLKCQKDIKL